MMTPNIRRTKLVAFLTAALVGVSVSPAHAEDTPEQKTYIQATQSIITQDCDQLLSGDMAQTTKAAAAMDKDSRFELFRAIMRQSYPKLENVKDLDTTHNGNDPLFATDVLAAQLEKRLRECNIVGPHGERRFYKDNNRDYGWLKKVIPSDINYSTTMSTQDRINQIIEKSKNRWGDQNPQNDADIHYIVLDPPAQNNNNVSETPKSDAMISTLMAVLSIIGVIAAIIASISKIIPTH